MLITVVVFFYVVLYEKEKRTNHMCFFLFLSLNFFVVFSFAFTIWVSGKVKFIARKSYQNNNSDFLCFSRLTCFLFTGKYLQPFRREKRVEVCFLWNSQNTARKTDQKKKREGIQRWSGDFHQIRTQLVIVARTFSFPLLRLFLGLVWLDKLTEKHLLC